MRIKNWKMFISGVIEGTWEFLKIDKVDDIKIKTASRGLAKYKFKK